MHYQSLTIAFGFFVASALAIDPSVVAPPSNVPLQSHTETLSSTSTAAPQCHTVLGKGRGKAVPTVTFTSTRETRPYASKTRVYQPFETIYNEVRSTVATSTYTVTETITRQTASITTTYSVDASETSTSTGTSTSTVWETVTQHAVVKRDDPPAKVQVPVAVTCKQLEVIRTTILKVVTAKRSKTTVASATIPVTQTVKDVTTTTLAPFTEVVGTAYETTR